MAVLLLLMVAFLFGLSLPFIYILLRFLYLMKFKSKSIFIKNKAKTIIVMGSGGHTMEMIMLLKTLDPNLYEPRLYVMADVDFSSEHKIKELEKEFEKVSNSKYEIVKVPRSRSVNQSAISSIISTLYSFFSCFPVVHTFRPDLVLSNGPGTCVPVCMAAYLLNCMYSTGIRIVYVESVCRVKTLSLSGKIMLYFADLVFVQWPDLHKQYPSTILLKQPL